MLRPAQINASLIGHALPWDVYTESGVLVASAGLLVADDSQFRKLTARPLFREMETGPARPEPTLVNLLERLESLAQEAETLLAPPYSSYLDAQVKELARELMALQRNDGDACLGYVRLAHLGRPSLRHCLHVLFVGQVLANHLDLDDAQRLSLAAAAITMNLAALDLHDRLHAQPGPMAQDERGTMAGHASRAAELLQQAGVHDDVWLEAVRQHHENMDGSGYPRGLVGSEIGLPARILRVADIYCAKLAARHYRPPKSAHLALQELFGRDKNRLDNQVAVLLLRRLGLFPPGTLVRLANRESACIARQGRNGQALSAVSFLDARGRPLEPPLERNLAHTAVRGYLEEDPAWPAFDWKRIWGY